MKFVKQLLMPLMFAAFCAAALCWTPNRAPEETREEPVQTAAPETEVVTLPVQQEPKTLLEEEGTPPCCSPSRTIGKRPSPSIWMILPSTTAL